MNQCKTHGDVLAVGVASDDVVRLYKPQVPVIPLEQRMEMLRALECVDIVRPYFALEYVSGCKELDIDVFVIGEDWGKNLHNIAVNEYLKIAGIRIVQIKYNALTSSTKIKQTVLKQSQILTELN